MIAHIRRKDLCREVIWAVVLGAMSAGYVSWRLVHKAPWSSLISHSSDAPRDDASGNKEPSSLALYGGGSADVGGLEAGGSQVDHLDVHPFGGGGSIEVWLVFSPLSGPRIHLDYLAQNHRFLGSEGIWEDFGLARKRLMRTEIFDGYAIERPTMNRSPRVTNRAPSHIAAQFERGVSSTPQLCVIAGIRVRWAGGGAITGMRRGSNSVISHRAGQRRHLGQNTEKNTGKHTEEHTDYLGFFSLDDVLLISRLTHVYLISPRDIYDYPECPTKRIIYSSQ